jgi:hypothetical protein
MNHLQDSFADALAPLAHLQTLRISLLFPQNSRNDVFVADQMEERYAANLAARFPGLFRVGFQSIHCAGPGDDGERYLAWENYDIIRGGSNGVVVVWDDPSK